MRFLSIVQMPTCMHNFVQGLWGHRDYTLLHRQSVNVRLGTANA